MNLGCAKKEAIAVIEMPNALAAHTRATTPVSAQRDITAQESKTTVTVRTALINKLTGNFHFIIHCPLAISVLIPPTTSAPALSCPVLSCPVQDPIGYFYYFRKMASNNVGLGDECELRTRTLFIK